MIGGGGLIGTKVVEYVDRAGEGGPGRPHRDRRGSHGRSLSAGRWPARRWSWVVSDAPSFEAAAALAFFEDSGRRLARAGERPGSSSRRPFGGRHRSPAGQRLFPRQAGPGTAHQDSGHPLWGDPGHAVLRISRRGNAAAGTDDNRVRLSNASFQPIAADDVAKAVAEAALARRSTATIEIAGPERLPMSELVARYLKATGDLREVVAQSRGALVRHAPRRALVGARRPCAPGDHPPQGVAPPAEGAISPGTRRETRRRLSDRRRARAI